MENHKPTDSSVIKEKIDKGDVKVKASRRLSKGKGKAKTKSKETKKQKEHSVKGVNGKITDKEVCAWIKQHDGEFTSTEIRDGLGFTSRTQARRVLRRLAKSNVVKIKTKQLTDKRAVYSYTA